MTRTGHIVAAVGLGAVGVGLVSIVLRETLGFSLSYTFVTLVGVLAAAQGLRYVSRRRRSEYAETDPGDPELRYQVPTPGDEFDRQVARAVGWSLRSVSEQRDVESRLRRVAVDSLVTHENCSVEEAEARIERGTWTDDAVAARFLSDDAPEPPLSVRLRGVLRRDSHFRRQVVHTIDALTAVQEGRR